MSRKTLRAAAMLAALVLFLIACNVAAVFIDTPAMRENAEQGVDMLWAQGAVPQTIGGFKSSQLDNFTSVLILKTAAYTGPESWLHQAFAGLRVDIPASENADMYGAWDAFCTYADGSNSPTGSFGYYRYWHGYILPLRILLCVLNLANIQMLLYFAQLALFVLVILLMMKRSLGALIPAFFTTYFLMMPFALGTCLQYMTVSIPMLLACVMLLFCDKQIDAAVGMPAFFAAVGIITNFLDLLTFPLVTLGFPLVLLLCLRLKAKDDIHSLFALFFFCCMGWGLGFGGMWAFKWLIVAVCFGWNYLGGIIAQAFHRVSAQSNGTSFSRFEALKINLDILLAKSSYLLILGLTGLASLVPGTKTLLRKKRMQPDLRALILVLPLLVSVAWFIVMANHSVDHAYYTYRNLAPGIFAGFACIACLIRTEE